MFGENLGELNGEVVIDDGGILWDVEHGAVGVYPVGVEVGSLFKDGEVYFDLCMRLIEPTYVIGADQVLGTKGLWMFSDWKCSGELQFAVPE